METKIINRVLALVGLKLQRLSSYKDPRDRIFELMIRQELRPDFIIDVGANHGNWSRRVRRYFPDAAITMIEPQANLRQFSDDLLVHPNVTWMTAGASNVSGLAKLTIAPLDHSSTFNLSPQQAKAAGLEQVEVPLVTLNQVASNNGNRIPEIVKIDAEGFDLKVIDGASDFIGKTEVFFLEAAVCARDIENDLPAVIRKMAELGYVPFDITELNYSPQQGVLWLVEVMFARAGGKMTSSVGNNY